MQKSVLRILEVESEVLRGNPLGDPTRRRLYVYLPPAFATSPPRTIPALLALSGFSGTGGGFFHHGPLAEGLQERLDRLIAAGACGQVIVVAPDCFTRVGGSQYLNSSATGRYQDYLLKEIIPLASREFSPSRWGVFGKSSGGFGAMILGMEFPEVFQAIANHSGDSNFEMCYLNNFWKALDKFKAAGGVKKWLDRFWDPENFQNRKDHHGLDLLGMAACYSPNPDSPHMGVDFPFDWDTGVFRQDVWERWRAWDPVLRMDKRAENLRKLRLAYVDCGSRDEYGLHWGSRVIASKLEAMGVPTHYEEFNDGHMSVSYRLDRSLPRLVKALE